MPGDLDEFMDVLGAAPATAVTLEVKLGFELVGHHNSCPTRCSDLRLGDSFAQAHVHGILPSAIMRSILIVPEDGSFVNLCRTLCQRPGRHQISPLFDGEWKRAGWIEPGRA